jgi:hypothetical protein
MEARSPSGCRSKGLHGRSFEDRVLLRLQDTAMKLAVRFAFQHMRSTLPEIPAS